MLSWCVAWQVEYEGEEQTRILLLLSITGCGQDAGCMQQSSSPSSPDVT